MRKKRIKMMVLRIPAGPPADCRQALSMRHVGLLIETDDNWGRSVAASICRYANRAGWTLLIGPRDGQRRLRIPRGWHGDGVIVSLRDQLMVQHVRRLKKPAVDVSMMFPDETWLGRVATDDQFRAKMALEHFRSRGLKHFACYSPSIGRYSGQRAKEFQRVIEKENWQCAFYPTRQRSSPSGWLTNTKHAGAWLRQLPKPLAVYAADPYAARQLVEICSAEALLVPDDVAILSGDDDDLMCSVANPQISSIELGSDLIGERAADMLNQAMQGRRPSRRPVLIRPLRVHARQSTNILNLPDAELVTILRYIREFATTGIRVADILREFPVSRRALELRFREYLKRSPAEEIRRVRFECARRLLRETDQSIAQIAVMSGFTNAPHFCRSFRANFGQSPSDLRPANRSSA